jgi:signal transduction histidine kinase
VKRAPSLTRRLILYSLFVQFAGSFVAWSIALLLEVSGVVGNMDVALADYAYNQIRSQVVGSLVEGSNGQLRIEPTQRLRDRMEQSPHLQYAVFRALEEPAIPGSSAQLVSLVENHKQTRIRGQRFAFRGDDGAEMRGYVSLGSTPYGPLFVAAGGYNFRWTDWIYAFSDDLDFIGLFVLLVSGASALVTWIGVREALKPLRRASKEAAQIDMASLGQGINPEGVPYEIRPIIDATNEALSRLDAGVIRMRRYTANAAHELRTPLAVLRARLQNPPEANFLADMERDTSQLQTCVEQMLVAARLGENQVSSDEDVDIVEATWSVVANRTPLAIRSHRHLEFDSLGESESVRGHGQAIASIIGNLVDNAIRAEPENGTIFVRVDGTTIAVIDHGEGVPLEDRETIFEPFWRKSETTPGSGLGLAIARELMDKLGGRIWVEDTPGGGATFKLWFPETETA